MGYEYIHGKELSPSAEFPQRESYKEVIFKDKIKDALFKINRDLPQDALKQAYRSIISFNSPSLEENNRYFHNLMADGIDVSFKEDRNIRIKNEYIIDFNNSENY